MDVNDFSRGEAADRCGVLIHQSLPLLTDPRIPGHRTADHHVEMGVILSELFIRGDLTHALEYCYL